MMVFKYLEILKIKVMNKKNIKEIREILKTNRS